MISRDSLNLPFWAMRPDEVSAALATTSQGLSDEEAALRLNSFGPNEITERERFTKLSLVFRQLKSPLIAVLIGAGVLTLGLQEWLNAGAIFAAVIVNTALGFFQENKAEHALAALKTYIRVRTRVRRRGREREVNAAEIVPGDVIHLTQGSHVPADSRVVFASNCEVDEAVLTGESLPVGKEIHVLDAGIALPERKNMLFGGTLVMRGIVDAVVVATGNHTEFGRIAGMVAKSEHASTPLQRAMNRFSVRVSMVLAVLVIALFGVGISVGYGVFDMFLIAVAVAVSAVPEGLPIAFTMILAVGVERLAKRKGVVRKLLAAETLGSTSLILTDKTGTLTQAKMELVAVAPYDGGSEAHEHTLLTRAMTNMDVVIENREDPPEKWQMTGRGVETALVRGAALRGVIRPEAETIIERLPFSSDQKYSVVVERTAEGARIVVVGAPEVLVGFVGMEESAKRALNADIDARAHSGERVLGVIVAEVSVAALPPIDRIMEAGNFRFLGMLSFRDPLRPQVASAIRHIASAGVRTVIVTGDHRGTAESVARSLDMIDGHGRVLTGEDLVHLSREELSAVAEEVVVYARVTPEQKVMLVKFYQDRGEIVAVTGDGVNDAPALEAADIGVAVGSGTDVTKNAADLVILDDNFETIVSAIEEGRRILDNIRKAIVYLLSGSLDELLLIGGALVFGIALPLNALQILFVNFFSDSFPALAFAFERGVGGLGTRSRRGDGIFDRRMRVLVLVVGASTSALLFVLYYLLLAWGFEGDLVRTFIFGTFAVYSLMLAFALRSLDRSIFSYNPFANRALTIGVGIGIALTLAALYIPALRDAFGMVFLPPLWLGGIVAVGIFNIAMVEAGKWFVRRTIDHAYHAS